MRNLSPPLSPEMWLRDMFASKAVQEGAVIRRKAREIERFGGWTDSWPRCAGAGNR
jgi:hypothetical protein